ncbi:hypothetical protein M3Y97_00831400 [Aphelenchoides bicaudatus]|nr:hypothetical protein M3Y97_00831400 [Aphelenchoides bicaudatus]
MAENIFNTFSFKKWTEKLREQKMEEEIQKQRMDQVARLRDKLGRERTLREQADMLNDDDIEQLINYLNSGGTLTGGYTAMAAPTNAVATNAPAQQSGNDLMRFGQLPKSDNFIMNEIKNYSKKNRLSSIPQTIFNYNRRYGEMLQERAQAAIRNQRSINSDKLKLYEFEYNRRNNIV